MGTRTYKEPADYNPGRSQFTIETSVENYHYLKVGGLSNTDLDLLRSLLPFGNIGFFVDGRESKRSAIEARYDNALGLRIRTNPSLVVDQDYEIFLPQPSVGLDEGAVELIAEETTKEYDDTIIVTGPGLTYSSVNQETTIIKSYTVGSEAPTEFVAKWYRNKQDWESGIELPANEAPTNVSFNPPVPVATRGQHRVVITFTPVMGSPRTNPAVLQFEVNY